MLEALTIQYPWNCGGIQASRVSLIIRLKNQIFNIADSSTLNRHTIESVLWPNGKFIEATSFKVAHFMENELRKYFDIDNAAG